MEKQATRAGGKVGRAPRPLVSGRRKAEAVLRVMAGENEQDVAAATGASLGDIERWRHEFVVAGERRMGELPLGIIERCLSPFERLVPVATLLSVAFGAVLFVQGQRRDREAREKEAAQSRQIQISESYRALDDKYIDYVKLCLQRPDLDVFDTPLVNAPPRTAEQRRQESMMLAILISVMERSYVALHDQSDDFKKREWPAWDAYAAAWATRTNFVAEWERTRQMFDRDFGQYMDELIRKGKKGPPG